MRKKIFFVILIILATVAWRLTIFENSVEQDVKKNGANQEAKEEMENSFNGAGFIRVGNSWVEVEIADTPQKRALGLGGRSALGSNQGMLFVFTESGIHSFWMAGMNFPIDIIWIGADLKVVDVDSNATPESYPATFAPKREAQFALEVPAFWAERNGIQEGTQVDIEGLRNILGPSFYEELRTPESMRQSVPFTSQAPAGNWSDARQQNACEEASALMVMRWVQWEELSAEGAEKEIIAISEYELNSYGDFHDTSAKDTVERIFKGYFDYQNVTVQYDIGARDIKKELVKGNLVIVPVNGQILKNPHYTSPGPAEHMVVAVGYDEVKKEFIVHDPGTRFGENFRYSYAALEAALQDYETGYHEPITEKRTAMIVVYR